MTCASEVPPADRPTNVAPGRLYVILSAEFRRRTAADCGWCKMPLIEVTEKPNEQGTHWTVHGGTVCAKCEPVVAELLEEHGGAYDVWPVYADSWLGSVDKPRR